MIEFSGKKPPLLSEEFSVPDRKITSRAAQRLLRHPARALDWI
jgi:hypothetical protein